MRGIDPTLVTKTCPSCGSELWRPTLARRPSPRTRGPVALGVILVLVSGVGGAIYMATRSAIDTRGREAPLKGEDTLRTAAAKANAALTDAQQKIAAALSQARALTGDPLATRGASAPANENYQWDTHEAPRIVAGPDGADAHIVGRIRLFGGSDSHLAIAVHDAKTLKRRWRTDSLGTWSADTAYRFVKLAIEGNALFVVDAKGRAVIHDLESGAAKMKLTLSDRVTSLCAAGGGELWLEVRDKQHVMVNVAAGTARKAKRPLACGGKKRRDPWADYCGRTRGAARPEAKCQRSASKALRRAAEGMRIDRVLSSGELAVAIGDRWPGTPYPLIAGVDDDTIRWRRPLNEEDADAAAEGNPKLAELKDGLLLVSYAMRTRRQRLTLIDAKDGKTKWLVGFENEPEREPALMRMTKTRVYLMRGSALEVLDASNGQPLGRIGR